MQMAHLHTNTSTDRLRTPTARALLNTEVAGSLLRPAGERSRGRC